MKLLVQLCPRPRIVNRQGYKGGRAGIGGREGGEEGMGKTGVALPETTLKYIRGPSEQA